MKLRKNIRLSFIRARMDLNEIKKIVCDWIYYFNNRQIRNEAKLEELERRVHELESAGIKEMVCEREAY